MKRNFCLSLFLAVALGSVVASSTEADEINAAPAGPLTVDAAVRLALENNPEIRVLLADIAAARAAVVTARAWQNPEITIAPGFKTVRDPSDTFFHGDFGLEQTFEWPGKRALRRALAEKNTDVRQLAIEGFRIQLAIQVRRVSFTLLTTREMLALREQRLTLAGTFVEAARKKVEGGFAPDFEATKAEVEEVSAQTSLREAQAQYDAARVALNSLMDRKPAEPLALMGTLGNGVALPGQLELLEKALAQNHAVKIQEAEAERTGVNLQAIRKSRLPDFRLGPNVEYARDEQIVSFGISVPLPLWDRKRGEIATAAAEQEKALAELEKLRREIRRDVITAAQNLAAAQESLAFYTPALRKKIKSALEAAAQSYSEGRTPLLLYLEMQRTYFDTQAGYFVTLQKLYDAQAELESAAGFPFDQVSQSRNELK